MNCDEMRNCIDPRLDGDLGEEQKRAMDEHLSSCPDCQKEWENAKKIHEALGKMDHDIQMPELVKRRFRDAAGFGWKKSFKIVGICAASFVFVLLCATLLGSLGGFSKSYTAETETPMLTGGYVSSAAENSTSETKTDTLDYSSAEMNEAETVEETAAPEANPEESSSGNGFSSSVSVDSGSTQNETEVGVVAREAGDSLKIIRSASVTIASRAFDEDTSTLVSQVEALGGMVVDSSLWGTSYDDGGSGRYASYTFRIPKDSFDSFLSNVQGVGELEEINTTSEDVTDQYTDYSLRLQTLQTQYQRVLELMKTAESVEDLISLESRLGDLEYQIESVQGQLRYWDGHVSYSTVNVQINEIRSYQQVAAVDDTLWDRMLDGIINSVNGLIVFMENLAVFLFAALPVLLIVGVVLGILIPVILHARKKRKARKLANQKPEDDVDAPPQLPEE